MAIAFTRRVSFQSSTDAASYASGSWTPATGEAHLCSVTTRHGTAPNTPTLTGNGLTWVAIDNATQTVLKTTTFYAIGVASPSAGDLTADFAGQTQLSCIIQVDELTDANDAAPVNAANKAKAAAGSGTALATAALTAVAAGNAIWAGCGCQTNEAQAAVADYTGLASTGATTPQTSAITIYDADGADVTPEFGSVTSSSRCIVGIEVVAAAVAGTSMDPMGTSGFFGL